MVYDPHQVPGWMTSSFRNRRRRRWFGWLRGALAFLASLAHAIADAVEL